MMTGRSHSLLSFRGDPIPTTGGQKWTDGKEGRGVQRYGVVTELPLDGHSRFTRQTLFCTPSQEADVLTFTETTFCYHSQNLSQVGKINRRKGLKQ